MKGENLLADAIRALLEWFPAHRRALPWRADTAPYHVWVSEIMLQQTRVEAVMPYYARFLAALPTVEALAACDDDRLMKLWQGLGYYSRARNLKRAAEVIVNEHGGVFPRTAASLAKLPGIGDYTAGAIASISFGEPTPAVDGNVLRVLSRLLAFDDDVLRPETKKGVTALLQAVYPSGEEATVATQALMELGEVICLPNAAPRCCDCPWQALCVAHALERERDFPVRSAKKQRRMEWRLVVLAENEGRYALIKRPPTGLLASLWEFPNLLLPSPDAAYEPLLSAAGFTWQCAEPLPDARHIFTHIEWRMKGLLLHGAAYNRDLCWLTPEEIATAYALPSAFKAYWDIIKPHT